MRCSDESIEKVYRDIGSDVQCIIKHMNSVQMNIQRLLVTAMQHIECLRRCLCIFDSTSCFA